MTAGVADMTPQERQESLAWRKLIADRPCAYCGEYSEHMHDDHIRPISMGGTDHWYNIVRACASCNLRKNAIPVAEFVKKS